MVRVAFYVRVSTERQQQAQTIEQQVARLREYLASQSGWQVEEGHIFRDDGYSGAKLSRPGLDALRDQAARAAFDRVLITAPDRLARNYVHQMVILEELERLGCPVEFIDRPMSDDPHDQLVLQIRGAVAEYEPVRSGLPFVSHAPPLHGVVSVLTTGPVSATLTLPSAVVPVPA